MKDRTSPTSRPPPAISGPPGLSFLPVLTLLMLVLLAGVQLYLVRSLRGLEQRADAQSENLQAIAIALSRLERSAQPAQAGRDRCDGEQIAAAVLERLRPAAHPSAANGEPSGASPPVAAPLAEGSGAEVERDLTFTTARLMSVNLRGRSSTTLADWQTVGRNIAELKDEAVRAEVVRELVQEVTRGELAPPEEGDYISALLGPSEDEVSRP